MKGCVCDTEGDYALHSVIALSSDGFSHLPPSIANQPKPGIHIGMGLDPGILADMKRACAFKLSC